MFFFLNSSFFLELQVFANLDHIDHTKHTLYMRFTNINSVNTFEQGTNTYGFYGFVQRPKYKVTLCKNNITINCS